MTQRTTFSDETRIIDLTVGEFKDLFNSLLTGQPAKEDRRVVKGIAGIMELFGVGQSTAQRYKDGILAPAVQQAGKGCSFVVDVERAIQLFNQHKQESK